MAENKPGAGNIVGQDLWAEAREASARPASRRDPRADPDDEPSVSARIEVVQVERGDRVSDPLGNAALSLRRELAKLSEQAAAVERTIEDQRRERSDALERVELAASRALDLEQKLIQVETEAANVRRQHDAALEDLQKVRAERDDLARAIEYAKSAADELARLKGETAALERARDEARSSAAKVETELAKLREGTTQSKSELSAAKERVEGLERERSEAKEQVEGLERALTEARAFEEKLTVLEADLATARAENLESRTEIARLERDVEAARHARDVSTERATMAERETESVRRDAERLQRELESAVIASASATTRAIAAERARSFVEDNVRQLQNEVTTAFARLRTTPHDRPSESLAGEARDIPPPPPTADPLPLTLTKRASTSFPPLLAEARPLSMPAPFPAVVPSSMDDDWGAPSRPPPASVSPTPRSVPPPLPSRSVPPPLPPSHAASVPPAVYPSVPPGAPPLTMPPPAVFRTLEDPPSGIHILSQERDELIELLGDPSTSHEAAILLRQHPEWLRGRPPVELLMSLAHLDYDVEAPTFELARAWDREPICRALVASFRDEADPKLREHGAWLLKHLGSGSAYPALAELVSNEDEAPAVRRWLLDAIERLVASRALEWKDICDLIARLVRNPDIGVRDGAIGIVAALDKSDDKRRVLLEILRTDDDEVVLSSTVHALTSALPIELDPAVAERLLGHPSARVQQSVLDFIERSKRAARASTSPGQREREA